MGVMAVYTSITPNMPVCMYSRFNGSPKSEKRGEPNLFRVKLSLLNEDLGKRDKRGNPDFEGSTFQGREYSIW
jgi:hypothetical protein